MNMDTIYILSETTTNGYYPFFLNTAAFISIFTAILVIITKNPVVSVLFLIALFITIAIYLILTGLSFLGLSYLLVYVGAVSILFIFILMLINVRISELLSETKNSIPLVFIISLCFNMTLFQNIPNAQGHIEDGDMFSFMKHIFGFSSDNIIYNASYNGWDSNMIENNHISSIGNVIYTSHNIWLIIVSLILLLAMVGAIVITIKYKKDNSINAEIILKSPVSQSEKK